MAIIEIIKVQAVFSGIMLIICWFYWLTIKDKVVLYQKTLITVLFLIIFVVAAQVINLFFNNSALIIAQWVITLVVAAIVCITAFAILDGLKKGRKQEFDSILASNQNYEEAFFKKKFIIPQVVQLRELKAKIIKYEEQKIGLEQDIDNTRTRLSELELKVESKNAAFTEREKNMKNKEMTLDKLEKKLNYDEEEIKEELDEIKDLKIKLREKHKEIKSIKNQNKEFINLKEKEKYLKTTEKELLSLKKSLEEEQERIEDQQDKLISERRKLEKLKTKEIHQDDV
ncbi:MAG: hypothetical protein AABW49_04230 [Nanoarchaeota archaeon]